MMCVFVIGTISWHNIFVCFVLKCKKTQYISWQRGLYLLEFVYVDQNLSEKKLYFLKKLKKTLKNKLK